MVIRGGENIYPREVEEVLLLRDTGGDEAERQARARFALRFQQLTGPVVAKAVEDTAFYRYPRLLTLNDVGGDPGRFGVAVVHLPPFHDSAIAAAPPPVKYSPTATQRRADAQETPFSMTPVPPAGVGSVLGVHVRPFQVSASATEPDLAEYWPTAKQRCAEGHDTADSSLSRAPAGLGTG